MASSWSEKKPEKDEGSEESQEEEEEGGGGPRLVGFERPSLLQDLRNILHEYPDNGQIFKEMFQNAEDAGAREVKIISVTAPGQTSSDGPRTPEMSPGPPSGEAQTPGTSARCQEGQPASRKQHGKSGRKQREKQKKEREKHQQKSTPSTAWRPPLVDVFSMPGLIVYNDAKFTDDDWKGIRKLHDSVKVKDPLKVGRFGLGFKSVFHLTDHPVIVSNTQMLFMDPFREEHEAIFVTSLSDLWPEERQGMHEALFPLLRKLDANCLTEKVFQGTVFWFPLRQEASDLSATLYTHDRVQQLKQALRGEIATMLLFLKKLERIEMYCSTYGLQAKEDPALQFSVALNGHCLAAVRESRRRFVSDITTPNKACPRKESCGCCRLTVDVVCQTDQGRTVSGQQHWLVVHYHQGLNDMSTDLCDLCQRNSLSHRPYVGVAARLDIPPDQFQGQLFSFLPLPPERPSPSGLPLHVHGFFELNQNRSHVKWPTSESSPEEGEGGNGPCDDSLLWNKLLVSESLPRAYTQLLVQLVDSACHTEGRAQPGIQSSADVPPVTADFLYRLWPDPDRVTTHWLPLIPPLYHTLPRHPVFFTPIRGGNWVRLHEAVVMPSPAEDEDWERAVVQVHKVCEVNLVCLPSHVITGLTCPWQADSRSSQESEDLPESQSACTNSPDPQANFKMVCPQHISAVMRGNLAWSHTLSAEQKCLLLGYLCGHGDPSLLQDLPLLPTVDGSFHAWGDQDVQVCRDNRDVELLRGLRHQLCFVTHPPHLQGLLQKLARQGWGRLQLIRDDVMPCLLEVSLGREHGDVKPMVVDEDDSWVRHVWDYLHTQPSLTPFHHLPLLPCPQERRLELKPLLGNYICQRLQGLPPPSPDLSAALGRLGVVVVSSLPEFVLRHQEVLHGRVQVATCLGVLSCLATLPTIHLQDTVRAFNARSTAAERTALVEVLTDKELERFPSWEAATGVLSCLRLFPVWPRRGPASAEPRSLELEMVEAVFSSVQENSRMTPSVSSDLLPPAVSFCPPLLYCAQESSSHRRLATALGGQEISLEELVRELMSPLSSPNHGHPDSQVVDFVTYFILSERLTCHCDLMDLARSVSFVPASVSGKLCKAGELYDPEDRLLQDLFAGEDLFPSKAFCDRGTSILKTLKPLGLRDVVSITESHLLVTARKIDGLCCQESCDSSLAVRKARALWEFLLQHSRNYSDETIQTLAQLRCLPCMSSEESIPTDYPRALVCPAEFSAHGLARAVEMCHHRQLKFMSSVRPVSLPISSQCRLTSLFYSPSCDDIIEHMEVVISICQKQCTLRSQKCFKLLLVDIFKELHQKWSAPHQMPTHVHDKMTAVTCVLIDRRFRHAGELWVQGRDSDDIPLSPYRFPLPQELVEEGLVEFFVGCGCRPSQDRELLQKVVEEIGAKHAHIRHSQQTCREDLALVIRILQAIRHKEGGGGQILLPVYTAENNVLRMEVAERCTVAPDPDFIEALTEEGEGLILVHPDLDPRLAQDLGAKTLQEMMRSGIDDVDIDNYSASGQHEELTTRLRNLLQDGYTDGFSVPKELIQNADDAGASVVKFLLDDRHNRPWRSGLLTSHLADFQGPALWVCNDAQFSAADFANLCKLGGATKKEDCSKVGKFGLGFNAVYNVTDLPSVYSASTLAMLDPHEKYLDSGRGKKMNFNNLMNKLLLKRFPNQFRPFHGIFDCHILDPKWEPYPGTLFRFPFRTESQALRSAICPEAFSRDKQQDFVNGLKVKGGNLLLFLQHVRRVELHHLAEQSSSCPELTVQRSSRSDRGVLAHFSAAWQETLQQGGAFQEQDMLERVTLRAETVDKGGGEHRQECGFHVAWAAGRKETCDIARQTTQEGFVPMAAVAVRVGPDDCLLPMDTCPTGFYKKGHLFCFLPLAAEVSEMSLPVHINAPFALSSDRRGLICETEDEKELVNGRWNKALFSDPIPRAYLAALERAAQCPAHRTPEVYYSLWPWISASTRQTPQSALCPAFYRLVREEEFRVLLNSQGAVPFSTAFFLEPRFQRLTIGEAAFRVLDSFWQLSPWSCDGGTLIDLPYHIATSISTFGPQEFQQRVITEEDFFQCILFPRIKENHADLDAHDRNQLVLHALLSGNPVLEELVRKHCCIPCVPEGVLNYPCRLIHPQGKAAQLFTEEDGRFPMKEEGADFTGPEVLSKLVTLDMVTDTVSTEELRLRAECVSSLESSMAANQRARAIIKYLLHLGDGMTSYAKALTDVCFLPCLQRPGDWPVSWWVEGQDFRFCPPREVYVAELKALVGCRAAVLDDASLDLSSNAYNTLKTLGVTVHWATASDREHFTQLVVNNLQCIANQVAEASIESVGEICGHIYRYLNIFCKGTTQTQHSSVVAQLKGQAVVWTDGTFLTADQLAFEPRDDRDVQPYLRTLDESFRSYDKLFAFLGVPNRFSVMDILGALQQIRRDKPAELSDADVDLIKRIADLLPAVLEAEGRRALEETETEDVHLPGRDNRLHPVGELCLNDCDWLLESDTMCFLHPMFSEELAIVFCVKSKREQDEDEFCESFGQHEQLMKRINRLLEGYTRDSSVFKELLQNADDAGASEVVFVKDWRQHSSERLLGEGWKEVQGPALCVFNDTCFTTRDMAGIQALGEGSKEGDMLKTGKYGVGFNSVYNLTDTPCFRTTVQPDPDDTAQVQDKHLGEKLCLFDPNFFVVSPRSRLPGQRLSVTERFMGQYPDMLSPFSLGEITQGRTGTVFRLPLRTEEKYNVPLTAEEKANTQPSLVTQGTTQHPVHAKSKISQPAASLEEVDSLLRAFQPVMGESLLFLSHVKSVSVYTASRDGRLTLDYRTGISTDKANSEKLAEFCEHVRGEVKRLKSEAGSPTLQEFTAREEAVLCCLSDSEDRREDWLVVHRFGLNNSGTLPPGLQSAHAVRKYRLLPLGGVAVCLSAPLQHSLSQAEARSLLAEVRSLQAEARSSRAMVGSSWAVADSSQAVADSSQAVADSSQAEARLSRAVADSSQAVAGSSQAEARSSWAVADSSQAEARSSRAVADSSQAMVGSSRAVAGLPHEAHIRDPNADVLQRVFHAFCMLPLPVTTGLPVHVNARFALDHETRGNLYSRPEEDHSFWNTLLAEGVIVPAYITALTQIRDLCFVPEGQNLHAVSSEQGLGKKRKWRSQSKRSSQTDRRATNPGDLSLRSSTDLSWKLDHYSTFFPQHQKNVDAFWNALVTSLYQQLAVTEAPVFPCVREDLNRLVWVPAKRHQGFPGYFWNLPVPRLRDVLMKLNMNIIECPFRIHESFIRSQVDTVKQVQRETVIEFLLSCDGDEADTCNLKHLPQPVQKTPFETVGNVLEVFRFIQNKSTNPSHLPLSPRTSGQLQNKSTNPSHLPLSQRTSGQLQNKSIDLSYLPLSQRISGQFQESTDLTYLPLSLRMSKQLHCFSSKNPTILSHFGDLLPESEDRFLHKSLINLISEVSDRTDSVRKLDITTFVQLLPHTLPQQAFGCGEVILANQLPFPSGHEFAGETWIRRLWEFLHNERSSDQRLESVLGEWSVLPSLKGADAVLFPLKKADNVVFIVKEHAVAGNEHDHSLAVAGNEHDCSLAVAGNEHDRSLAVAGNEHDRSLAQDERVVNQCLEKLSPHLNMLNTAPLPEPCVATQMVASVHNPQGLLHALTHVELQPQNLSSAEAQHLLDFFYNKLTRDSISAMRFLPFFERPDGRLTAVWNTNIVLRLPDSVPLDGLIDWSYRRRICLVKTNGRLEQLFKQLRFEMPTELIFYSSQLLPSIADLPKTAIKAHMEYIRDILLCDPPGSEKKRLLKSLRETRFITGPDGTLCRASDFYSPDCGVFAAMLTKEHFPPAPFDRGEWREFLNRIGMICTVSVSQFLRFARKVEKAGKKTLPEKVREQSHELSCYLKKSGHLREETFLKEVKDIKFLLPQQQHQMESGRGLGLIHPVFTPPSPLVSFSEGQSARWLFLVWTTSCVFSANADPATFHHWEPHMDDWIGFKRQPSTGLVITHVKKVCQELGKKRSDGSSLLATFKDSVLDVVGKIMENVYTHLKDFADTDLEDLQDINVIFDRETKSMFSGEQVVLNILEEQLIEGHVVRAPQDLGKFFPLFKRLGTCEQVNVNHYARALEQIHKAYVGTVLNPNDLELVCKAVDCLFKQLGSGNKSIRIGPIYLPADYIITMNDRTPTVRLVDSRQILLEVSVKHQRRMKTPIKDLLVFVEFSRLGLEGHDLHRESLLLPESLRMKTWYEVVKEILMESCRTLAVEDENTRYLTRQLHSKDCADAVKRIVNHTRLKKGEKFTEDDAEKIEEGLKTVTVFKVTDLWTVLIKDGSPLSDTEEDKAFFVTNDDKNQDSKQVFIFINSSRTSSITFRDRTFRTFVHMAFSRAVGHKIDRFLLDMCLEDLLNAQEQLDEEDITPYPFQPQTVLPPNGSFVHPDLHCLLDPDLYEYKVGKYVACELYDPILDFEGTDLREPTGAAEDTATTDRGTCSHSQSRKAVYIHTQVRQVIPPSTADEADTRTRLMLLRYVIDLGEEQTKEVEAMKLCKFIRPSLDSMVPFIGDTTQLPSAFSQPDQGDDMKKVLADIRHQLKKIWQNFPDRQSHWRAVKRLLLNWHPDKNPGREEFCTKVFYWIQHYVLLLEEGKELPSDDDGGDNVAGHAPSGSGHSHDFFSSFFENVFSQGRCYAESRRRFHSRGGGGRISSSGGGGGGRGGASWWFFFFSSTSADANPQPEEGRRWMRQSLQDLQAARMTLHQGGQGLHNWACYQAHQTAEKALKAVLYRRDVRDWMKYSHDICSLAGCIGDLMIEEHVTSLDHVTKFHTAMRYPDLQNFPKIPSDVYQEQEARQACELAEKIVDRAQELFDSYKTPPRRPSPPRQRRSYSPPAAASSSHGSISYGHRRPLSSAYRASAAIREPPSRVLSQEFDLQLIVDRFAEASHLFGHTISLGKTEVLYQPAPKSTVLPPSVSIEGTELKTVEGFKYLAASPPAIAPCQGNQWQDLQSQPSPWMPANIIRMRR